MRLDLDIDPTSLPTAQQKGVTRDGRVYTKAKVARAKLRLTEAIREAVQRLRPTDGGNPFEVGSLLASTRGHGLHWSVAIEFVYALKGTPKRLGGFPKPTRPDLDNLTKLVLDAMTASFCFFADDGQVVSLATLKRHAHASPAPAEPAHITIFARPLGDDELEFYAHNWRNGNERRS